MPKTDKWERQHRADMARIERQVLAIYEAAAREAAAIGMTVGDLTGDLFTFDRYPITKERIEHLINDMHDRLETVVVDGVNSQWTLANNKNNELCRRVFGSALNSLTLQQQRRYFNNHDAAREAFLARKEAGLGLSDRVWRYSDLYRHEIELGLDVGLRAGTSADELTRELRSYLKYPDKLFRRVRDEHGQLVLSQAAKDFHPGQGVYRSSYMNARRLAATETNMAYRTADYDRYQDLDFVVGIEVHLSNNHNCKGVPAGAYYDICDELQGKYPKDFKFTGWHPHCRCYVTTILKTDKEIAADNEHILRGEEPLEGSENEVRDVPDSFKNWLEENRGRIVHHNSLPYFLSDNGSVNKKGDFVVKQFSKKKRHKDVSTNTSKLEQDGSVVKSIPTLTDTKVIRKKAGFMQDDEMRDLLNLIINNNQSLFNGKCTKILVVDEKYMAGVGRYQLPNGGYDYSKFELHISKRDVAGGRFNMLIELKGAFGAIARGKQLTFNQEYAIECLWHEFRHAQAKGFTLRTQGDDHKLVAAMECINQFCARQSYDVFLKSLGGKATHKADVISGGFGYQKSLNNFHTLLRKIKVTQTDAFAHFERIIQERPYEDIFEEVATFIENHSKIGKNDAERLVEKLSADSPQFEHLLDYLLKGVK